MDTATVLVNRIKREADVARLRARNGIRLAGGRQPPRSGQTPKDVIWRQGNAELWRYRGSAEDGPVVVLIHSLVSRSYILDLYPGSSLVEDLTASAQVFLLDWGIPDRADAANTIETYVDELMPAALEVVRTTTGRPTHLIGYCLGGILALLHTARHPESQIKTLTTLAAPIDFSQLGMVISLLREGRLDVDDLCDETGNIPPAVFRQAFRVMQPTAEITQYVNLLQNLWNDQFVESHQAMSRWIGDHIPFPGGVARQATELFIRRNSLLNGDLELGGTRVDLGAIDCPVLCVAAERDHIVPLSSATPLVDIIGSPQCRQLNLHAGHVALVMGRQAKSVTIPAVLDHVRHAAKL